ncbi:hypothetical protein P691DRAFT_643924, partial [Macrolepiota fuliginosa MF-IS2]
EWGPLQQEAQQRLKDLVRDCFHTWNPKFPSDQPIVVAVDSSWRAVGYYMFQRDDID